MAKPGSIPLEMLGSDNSREILNGANPTGVSGAQPSVDRSEALATAIQEWYGWTNWANKQQHLNRRRHSHLIPPCRRPTRHRRRPNRTHSQNS